MHGVMANWGRRLSIVLCFVACHAPQLLDVPLSDGRTLETFVAGRDSVTLLLYDPADGLASDHGLTGQLEAWRHIPGRVVLVLTRAPDPDEENRLESLGIHADGTIDASWRYANLPHPARYLYVAGVPVKAQGVTP